jgi:sRNA-binding protein
LKIGLKLGELNSENKIQIRIMLEAIVRTTLEIQGDKVRVALQNAREIINL